MRAMRMWMVAGAMAASMLMSTDAIAEFAGRPQRVYRGRTYIILDPVASATTWYAGDGVVRTEGQQWSRTRVTTKRYFAEK